MLCYNDFTNNTTTMRAMLFKSSCRNLKVCTICMTILTLVSIEVSAQVFDKFGGYSAISREPTGYFSLGQAKGRHFLFTPEGHAFISLGINHFHTTQRTDYNRIVKDLKSWGFNSGCYQGPKWMWDRVPYSKGINLLEIRSYLSKDMFQYEDVFDPTYLEILELKIRKIVEPQVENQLLIGYFLTDMPVWTGNKYGMSWIKFFRSLPDETPGAQVFQGWKQQNPEADEQDFLALIARQLYSRGTAFIRKYDSNHLIFSDRYNEYDISEIVVHEVLPFVDAIATQPSNEFHPKYFDFLYNTFQKPIFIADHVSSFETDEYPVTMGQVAKNEENYLQFYSDYIDKIFTLPFIIGFNKCQFENEERPGLLKQGLTMINGEPYDYVSKLYDVHTKALLRAYTLE